MQALEINWYRWLLAVGLMGVTLALFLWLGFYLPSLPRRAPSTERPRERFPRGIEVAWRGVPPVLVWFYVLMGLFIVVYTVFTAWTKVRY